MRLRNVTLCLVNHPGDAHLNADHNIPDWYRGHRIITLQVASHIVTWAWTEARGDREVDPVLLAIVRDPSPWT